MSGRFQVTMHGSGFSIPVGGDERARGFYATRRVRAATAKDAGHDAVLALDAEERFRWIVESTMRETGQEGTVEPEDVTELSWFSWYFTRSPRGFIFYTDENTV